MAIELSLLAYAFVRAAEFHMRLERANTMTNPKFQEADQRYLEAFKLLLPEKVLQETCESAEMQLISSRLKPAGLHRKQQVSCGLNLHI